MLTTSGDCDVCGATGGKCNDLATILPALVALAPLPTRPRSGRFYRTTERVWHNNRLVVGEGQDIPWEDAIAYGLVPAPPEPEPLAVKPEIIDEVEVDPDAEEPVVKPELVSDELTTAAIKRRAKKNPNGKLGGVS